jgi:hypothetical protein
MEKSFILIWNALCKINTKSAGETKISVRLFVFSGKSEGVVVVVSVREL